MLRILILFGFLFAISISSTQAQIKLRGGVNFANISFSPGVTGPKTLPTFHLGVIYVVAEKENIDFTTGLLYTNKGLNFNGLDDTNIKYTYLEIPIDVSYKINSFRINGGPYLAYALTGKANILGVSQDIQFGKDDAPIGAGLQFSLGLQNISTAGSGSSAKHKVTSLYMLYCL